MGFNDRFNKVVEEKNLGGFIDRPHYRTGIDYLDYINGRYNSKGELNLGISGGRFATFVGGSGSGKSTLADQAACNIVKQFQDDGTFIIYDCEKSSSYERVSALGAFDINYFVDNIQDKMVKIINDRTNTQGLFNLVTELHAAKMEYFTGAKVLKDGVSRTSSGDEFREKIFSIPPTIILVDSWAKLVPEGLAEKSEMNNNMTAATVAKENNGLVKQITDKLFEANIMLWSINHITTDIQTGYVVEDKRPIKWLKMGESLPGGREIIYMSDCLVRLEQKARLKKDAEFFIEGFISEGTLLKSRSNASGIQVPFIFEQRTGIDNILTNYLYLKNNGLIVGGGRGGFCLKEYPDYKFSQKDIRDMYKSNKEFRKAFNEVSREAMLNLLTKFQAMDQNNGSDEEESNEEREEITAEQLSKMNFKHLKEVCKQYGVDVDWRDYNVNNYKELRQTLVEDFDTYFK